MKFNELCNEYEALSSLEKSLIIGGVGTPLTETDLKKMFDYSALGGFDTDLAKLFNKEISLLASTDVGSDVLQGLLYKAKENPINQIILTKLADRNAAAYYKYEGATHKSYIDIGRWNVLSVNDKIDVASAFHTTGHEIFHAFESIVRGNHANNVNDSVTNEIDANLFAGFAEKQLDAAQQLLDPVNNNTDIYYRLGAGDWVSRLPTNDGQVTFNLAWSNIVDYNDFTLINYNKLVSTFKDSKYNSNGIYDTMTSKTLIEGEILAADIFNLFLTKVSTTFNGGGGDSGGQGTGNDGGGYYQGGYGGSWGQDSGGNYNPGSSGGNTNLGNGNTNTGTYQNGPGGGTTGYGGSGYLQSH